MPRASLVITFDRATMDVIDELEKATLSVNRLSVVRKALTLYKFCREQIASGAKIVVQREGTEDIDIVFKNLGE